MQEKKTQTPLDLLLTSVTSTQEVIHVRPRTPVVALIVLYEQCSHNFLVILPRHASNAPPRAGEPQEPNRPTDVVLQTGATERFVTAGNLRKLVPSRGVAQRRAIRRWRGASRRCYFRILPSCVVRRGARTTQEGRMRK